MRLKGKRAFLTAAGHGIGRATAEAFVAEGAHVIATDIDASALSTLAGCETSVLDVTDRAAILHMAEKAGAVDILFNCAGVVHGGAILDCEEADWNRALDLNVTSMYRIIKAFLPAMLAAGAGSIINMSSVAGSCVGVPNRFAYGATKAAVAGITRSVAADYVKRGVRCNAICPGTVDTPSLQERLRATGDYEAARTSFMARQPMGRLGEAKEIAALAVYLASDESAFTTGVCHVIDGGWTN